MSTLQVANIHFSSGGTTRIDQVGSTVNIISPSTNVSGNLVTTATVTAANVVVGNTNISTFMGPYKNKIINGNFDIWQRANSVASVSDMSYLADRWITYKTGTTANVSRQSFTLGQTDVPGEPTYFQRHVVTSSAGASNYMLVLHPVESVKTLAGRTATLSFWAKADAAKNIAVEMEQYFGSGGSPSSTVRQTAASNFALSTSWKKFTWTVNVPSISGKTIGSIDSSYLGFAFWFDAGSSFNSRTNSLGQQSGTFDIAQVQLEEGPVATAFEQRSPGQELRLCQRYYWKASGFFAGMAGGYRYAAGISNYAGATFNFPVTMRTLPTWTNDGAISQENCTLDSSYITVDTFAVRLTANAAGQFRYYPANFWVFSAD